MRWEWFFPGHGDSPASRLRRLTAVALVATAALPVLAGCGQAAPAAPADPAATAAPARTDTTTAPGACPDAFRPLDRKPAPTRSGDLVPGAARAALLCTYAPGATGTDWTLSRSTPLPDGRQESLASYLNGLPQWRAADGEADGCLLGAETAQQIVLDYGDRPPVTVTVDCAVAVHDGVVRRLTNSRQLLGYWPAG